MPYQETPAFLLSPEPGGSPTLEPLGTLLLGQESNTALPALADVATAAMALATGKKQKVLLALSEEPSEFAFVRDADDVLVSWYGTGSAPEVLLLNRRIRLDELLGVCSYVSHHTAHEEANPTTRDIYAKLANRVDGTDVAPQAKRRRVTARLGGAVDEPKEGTTLSFGFSASIPPSLDRRSAGSARADVHAMLFSGTLWAWVHGRRVALCRGPIFLAAQRMVSAVGSLMDAWDAERPMNVKLRAGGFHVSLRMDKEGRAGLTLGPEGLDPISIPDLAPADVALPILRLASDLLRALVTTDRSQSRNLRVRAAREEIRALRKRARSRARTDGFVNGDPERLRASQRTEPPAPAPLPQGGAGLRFAERWTIEAEGLDAGHTFLCGDRLVLATPKRVVALDRDSGSVLWAREGAATSSFMAGPFLVRIAGDGDVAIVDVGTGEVHAESRIRHGGSPVAGLFGGTHGTPPSVLLTEGPQRIACIDLRTGELRWRYMSRGPGPLQMARSGRVLVVTAGDGTINAIDVHTGDVAWRVSEAGRFSAPPTFVRDRVIAVSGDPRSSRAQVLGIDLYSGRTEWSRTLEAPPTARPLAHGKRITVPVGHGRRTTLITLQAEDGSVVWTAPDPGLGIGGEALAIDRALIVNAPNGTVTALDEDSGAQRWQRKLSDPVADDVPRRLEPVLRGGALFVPASKVHVLRPKDGSSNGDALPCDLVPDLIRVDERGWVYIAEESGHLEAYAPVAQLRLVKG